MTQRMIEITSPLFIAEERLLAGERPPEIFGGGPLALEIGCGLGDFVTEMAARHPETTFLAVDIYNKGCFRTCRKAETAGLRNIRVMRMEARWLLARWLPPESLSAVYINCPDPWPKKRHRRRRLVNADFLAALLGHMKPEGEFFFASDFRDYALDVAELIDALPGWRSLLEPTFSEILPDYPRSKYMRRFLERGEPIFHVRARRDPSAQLEPTAPPPLQPGFRMPLGAVLP